MVRAAVGAVDDGVGFTGELVLKALVHQTPDDGRAACAGVDHIIGDAAILPALGEDAVHRLDDIAAHAEVAERALGFEDNLPFAWTRRSGETHLLPVDRKSTRLNSSH